MHRGAGERHLARAPRGRRSRRAGIGGVDLIKVDGEGYEADVLEGLAATIRRHRPVILFEFDGRASGADAWNRFAAPLPRYRFGAFTASPGTGLARWWGVMRRGGEAMIVPINRPAARYYEAIFASPE